MKPGASVVIRARNEAKWLPLLLQKLAQQTVMPSEIILVDNESTDKTIEIFKNSNLDNKRIINLPEKKFTYPLAANLGVKVSSTPIIVFLSGHSIPLSNRYIEGVISELSQKNVAGAYGDSLPLPDATAWEKFYYRNYSGKTEKKEITKPGLGVMGMTSAAIKKDLWRKYHFNETVSRRGGEDAEWAYHFQKRGYKIIKTPKMLVRHSHGYGVVRFTIQYFHWLYVFLRAYFHNL